MYNQAAPVNEDDPANRFVPVKLKRFAVGITDDTEEEKPEEDLPLDEDEQKWERQRQRAEQERLIRKRKSMAKPKGDIINSLNKFRSAGPGEDLTFTPDEQFIKLKRFIIGIDDELEEVKHEEEEEDEQKQKQKAELDRKKAERIAKRRKWQGKKCMLLSMFILALFIGVACLGRFIIMQKDFGPACTDYSSDSSGSSLLAFIGLMLLSPFGFVVLAFRISNLFVGMVFMFCIILVISFAMSGTSRAVYSILYDKLLGTMKQRFEDNLHVSEEKYEKFYDKLQANCECCGFREMDRLRDWPTHYLGKLGAATPFEGFPNSCCRKGQKLGEQCGMKSKLARMKNGPRIPGGFLILRPESKMEEWTKKSVPSYKEKVKPTKKYLIAPMQNTAPPNGAKDQNTLDTKHQIIIVDGYAHDTYQIMKKKYTDTKTVDKWYLHEKVKDKNYELRYDSAPPDILVLLDAFVDEMIYGVVNNVSRRNIQKGQWIYFELLVKKSLPRNENAASGDPTFKLYYVTRGLAENYLYDDILWRNRCERTVTEDNSAGTGVKCKYFKKKGDSPNNYFKDENGYHEYHGWRRPELLNPVSFFKHIIDHRMKWLVGTNGAVIGVVFILALIFWYFYSRLKAEEQADLALPTDFDLLHLDLPSFNELDEAAKALEEEILRLRLQEQHERLKREEEAEHIKNQGHFHMPHFHLPHIPVRKPKTPKKVPVQSVPLGGGPEMEYSGQDIYSTQNNIPPELTTTFKRESLRRSQPVAVHPEMPTRLSGSKAPPEEVHSPQKADSTRRSRGSETIRTSKTLENTNQISD